MISAGEEHYALFRLVDAGYRIAYTPRAIVYHENPPPTREYRQKVLAEAIAYIAFLFWHHPRFSWRLTRFVIEGVFRKKRAWRNQTLGNRNDHLSLREVLAAIFSAMKMLWRDVRIANEIEVIPSPNPSRLA